MKTKYQHSMLLITICSVTSQLTNASCDTSVYSNVGNLTSDATWLNSYSIICSEKSNSQVEFKVPLISSIDLSLNDWQVAADVGLNKPEFNFNNDVFSAQLSPTDQRLLIALPLYNNHIRLGFEKTDNLALFVNAKNDSNEDINSASITSDQNTTTQLVSTFTNNELKALVAVGKHQQELNLEFNKLRGFYHRQDLSNNYSVSLDEDVGDLTVNPTYQAIGLSADFDNSNVSLNYHTLNFSAAGKTNFNDTAGRLLYEAEGSGQLVNLHTQYRYKGWTGTTELFYGKLNVSALARGKTGLLTVYSRDVDVDAREIAWLTLNPKYSIQLSSVDLTIGVTQFIPIFANVVSTEYNQLDEETFNDDKWLSNARKNGYQFGDGLSIHFELSLN